MGLLGEYDEIALIVCRPVQKEIDRHKQGGNGRLARRARAASGTLRKVVANNLTPIIIRETSPRVVLSLRVDLKPAEELGDTLNYAEPDDALIGIAHGYAQTMAGQDVAVLTDDTSVMASAAAIQAKHLGIPEEWFLAPEPSKAEKDLKDAQAEVQRLRNSEPVFNIRGIDADGRPTDAFVLEYKTVRALTGPEISSLMDYAKQRFPMVTDFERKAVPSVDGLTGRVRLEALKGLHLPPDTEQIEAYHEAYRTWEQALGIAIETIHKHVRKDVSRLPFSFEARNTGTRPATEVLVEMRANGPFLLRRPDRDSDNDRDNPPKAALPSPPPLPKSRLLTRSLLRSFSAYDALRFRPDLARSMDFASLHVPKHNPEAFYYKGRSALPSESVSLKCDLWRHARSAEGFSGEIELDEAGDCRGSIEFQIHASNLSDAVSMTAPVEIRAISYAIVDHVHRLIGEMKEAESQG